MKIEIDLELEHLRYSLVGDGYILSEVKEMNEEMLVNILKKRIKRHIEIEYNKSRRLGLLNEN